MPVLITIPDLCSILKVGRSTAFKLIRERQIEICKVGHRTLVLSASVEALIARNTRGLVQDA